MNIQDSLFQRWQECWRDHTQRDLGDSLESHPEEKLFLDVFKESYQDSVKKSEKNRINNFKFKGWFLKGMVFKSPQNVDLLPVAAIYWCGMCCIKNALSS